MSIDDNKKIYIGYTNFRNVPKLFGIKKKDRRQHMYIIGKSGTGKTALLYNLIIQDIFNNEGLCVIDPHGELAEKLLLKIPKEREKDVIYFDPSNSEYCIGFNILELPDERYKNLVASGLMSIFTKIWANVWSARMEYILNNAILALLDTPGSTLLGINRILVDKDYREYIVGNIKDPVVKAFWINEFEQWKEQFRNEAVAPIQNKVGQFLSTKIVRNIIGQQKSTINIFDVMNKGKILILNLAKGKIGEDVSSLLGSTIITKIQLASMERINISENERKDFYLYIDEFQNFATNSFADILSESRKFKLNLIIAHQYVDQLRDSGSEKLKNAVFGNIGTIIVFRVGAKDAEFLEKEFLPEVSAEDMINLPNYNIYIKLLVDGVTSRPFSAVTIPPLELNNKSKDLFLDKEKVIKSVYENYAKPVDVVEREINSWIASKGFEQEFICKNCGKKFSSFNDNVLYCQECSLLNRQKQNKVLIKKSNFIENKNFYYDLAKIGIEFKLPVLETNKKRKIKKFFKKKNINKIEENKVLVEKDEKRDLIENLKDELKKALENIN